jgi:hypothetical protein
MIATRRIKFPDVKHWTLEIHNSLVRDWMEGCHISIFYPDGDIYTMENEPYLNKGYFSLHPINWKTSKQNIYTVKGYEYFTTTDDGLLENVTHLTHNN